MIGYRIIKNAKWFLFCLVLNFMFLLMMSAEGARSNPPKKSKQSVGYNVSVKFSVSKGSLYDALREIEDQIGVRFSVLPELLPENPTIKAFNFTGPLKNGLTKITKPLNLIWKPGVQGGIVLLPAVLKIKQLKDWIADEFPVAGIKIIQLRRHGRQSTLRPGDILIGLNGELHSDFTSMYRAVIKAAKENENVKFSVQRGKKIIQLNVHMYDPDKWLSNVLGIIHCEDVPNNYEQYLKSGHRDSKWDAAFKKTYAASETGGPTSQTWAVSTLANECRDLGCRDPQLLEMSMNRTPAMYHVRYWDWLEKMDTEQLRTSYGGSRILARVQLATKFARQGSHAIREKARRYVEVGWEVLRNTPGRFRRNVGYAIACLYFQDGHYVDCIKWMRMLNEDFVKDPDARMERMESVALLRLGKYAEAIKLERKSSAINENFLTLLQNAEKMANGKSHVRIDRLNSNVALSAWRPIAALRAIAWRHQKKYPKGIHPPMANPPPGNLYNKTFPITFKKPSTSEIWYFPYLARTYSPENHVDLVYGVQFGKRFNTEAFKKANIKYGVRGDLELFMTHGTWLHKTQNPHYHEYDVYLPLMGFANDGKDILRIVKSSKTSTVRCNGVWVFDAVSPYHAKQEGHIAVVAMGATAAADLALFIPSKNCYDNDRIRELMDKIINPKIKMSAVEAVKLWDEAANLGPPNANIIRAWRKQIPKAILKAAPRVKYTKTPPILKPLTLAQAKARFLKRGQVQWVLGDNKFKQDFWCARPDGTLEVMGGNSYFTTKHLFIKRITRKEKVVINKPLFLPGAILIPTDSGLFHYKRSAGSMARLVIGNLFHAAPISSVAVGKTGLEIKGKFPGAPWRFDFTAKSWKKAP